MNTTVAKVAGWVQFIGQLGAQVAAGGLPTSPLGWAGLVGSLVVAIGMHASAQTDGSK